jgi:hypothetical protein
VRSADTPCAPLPQDGDAQHTSAAERQTVLSWLQAWQGVSVPALLKRQRGARQRNDEGNMAEIPLIGDTTARLLTNLSHLIGKVGRYLWNNRNLFPVVAGYPTGGRAPNATVRLLAVQDSTGK